MDISTVGETMAAMALPINALLVEAEKAQAETKTVISASSSAVANFRISWQVFKKTIMLRHSFGRLANNQQQLISLLTGADFSTGYEPGDLAKLANKLDDLLGDERTIIADASTLGVQIRVWWQASLLKLADQVEHLDSISESLHIASDGQATALMAMAAEQFAEAGQLSLQ